MKPRKLYLDQYGNRFYANTRKELKAQIPGRIGLMYRDRGAQVIRVGYVIGQHWLTEYVANEREVR